MFTSIRPKIGKIFANKAYETRKNEHLERCQTDLLNISCEEAISTLNILGNERTKITRQCQVMPFDSYRRITNIGFTLEEKKTTEKTFQTA